MSALRWDDRALRSLAEAYAAGKTADALGKEHGCSLSRITFLLRRAGVEMRAAGVTKKLTPTVFAEAVRLYKEGNTLEEVGHLLDVSASLLCVQFKRAGIETRESRPRNERKVEDGTLECLTCHRVLPLSEFSSAKRGVGGRKASCRLCAYFSHVERTFCLSREAFAKMWEAQKGTCDICGGALSLELRYNGVHVDHSHNTGKLRSLLCPPCNKGLGNFRDSREFLRRADAYLAKHGEPA